MMITTKQVKEKERSVEEWRQQYFDERNGKRRTQICAVVKIPIRIIELCYKHGLRRGLDFFKK